MEGIEQADAERFVGRKYSSYSYDTEDKYRKASALIWEDVITVVFDEDEEQGTGFYCMEYAAGETDLLKLGTKHATAKRAVQWFNRRAVYRRMIFIENYDLWSSIWYARYKYARDRAEEERKELEEGFHPSYAEVNGHNCSCICEVCWKTSLFAIQHGDIHEVHGYRRGLSNYHAVHCMSIEEYIVACGYDLDDPFAEAYRLGVEEA